MPTQAWAWHPLQGSVAASHFNKEMEKQ